jgi:hypothetical protein
MTSSVTSTDDEDQALAESGGDRPPDRWRWLTLERAIVLGLAVLPALALIIGFYGSTPTVAAFFLGGAWVALVGAGNMLRKAVMAIGQGDDDVPLAVSSTRRTELEREKKLLLKAIKEVEFDRDMGKIDDADAGTAIATYRRRALEVLTELGTTSDYRTTIEKELARRTGKLEGKPAPRRESVAPLAEPEAALPAAPPRPEPVLRPETKPAVISSGPIEPMTSRPTSATRTCASCATVNDTDAVFCKRCATKL